MPALAHLCLLLAAFSALVSAAPATLVKRATTVYNNCSGDSHDYLPTDVESTQYFKPQVHIKPEDLLKNGSGWEEWLLAAHNTLDDGSEIIYGCKWVLGDPTSANYSHLAWIGWTYFPNGTYYRQIDHADKFVYQDNSDGGFTFSIANNSLSWIPSKAKWHASFNSGGFLVEVDIEDLSPYTPYGPNYQGENGQISKGYFSRIEAPRARYTGTLSYPWGLKYNVDSTGTVKHTWSYGIMAEVISAYIRGSTFFPGVGTVNWYQAWDESGKTEVDSMQFLAADGYGDDQVFRLQATDDKIIDVVTTPVPTTTVPTYNGTVITFPMCAPGAADCTDKAVWKINNMFRFDDFIDFAGAHTLYQRVNVSAHLWIDGKVKDVDGGFGLVEVYHRQ